MLKGKKILITGGAGFIGSNLCDFFTHDNEVLCIDNLITGNKENINHLIGKDNFNFFETDIRNFEACVDIFKDVDIVFHQAALGSVPRSVKNPLDSHAHNASGFLNVIEAARIRNVSRFVFATSSSTYGDSKALPKVEGERGNLLSPYAVTKRLNELYADVYNRTYGLQYVGLRYFNVFGPNQNPNGAYAAVIPKFVKAIIEGNNITVNGDGNQTRDFTYVDNVVLANLLAATVSNQDALNCIYNIAYGEKITINGLIEVISEVLGELGFDNEVNVKYVDKRVGDIEHSYASLEKAKKGLGYIPKVSLKEGMKKYLKNILC